MKDTKCTFDKLFDMFRLHGAKTLTMDDIAKAFSISKKTLYKQYRTKEEMLYGVLTHVSDKMMEQAESLKTQYDCPIEILVEHNNRIRSILGDEKNTFILQLAKYYPEVLHQHQKDSSYKILSLLEENYDSGLEKGLYRTDISKENYLKFFLTLSFSVKTSPLFNHDEQEQNLLQKDIIQFYLDAIVTEKGKKRLKELNKRYEEFN